jgi:multiple sugar transport system permease protein
MAAATVVILPVLLVFFFAQKVFIQGIATSGIKG